MQPTEHENLNTLASSAHRQIAGRHGRAIPRSMPMGVRRRVLAALIWLAVATPLALNMGGLRSLMFGLPASAARAEAKTTLMAARQAVESHKSSTGQMPERVPLAALDALVQLETTPNGYRLRMRGTGAGWQMDEKGQWTE